MNRQGSEEGSRHRTSTESAAAESLEGLGINGRLLLELKEERDRQVDANAGKRLLSPKDCRNDEFQEDWIGQSDDGMRVDEKEQKLRRKKKLQFMASLRTDMKGIYDGRRSVSTSPSPAPFICMTGAKPRELVDRDNGLKKESSKKEDETNNRLLWGEGKYHMSRNQLEFLGKLYLAFKRADRAADERPTGNDIRQTFRYDAVVHEVFNLETKSVEEKREVAPKGEARRQKTVFGLQQTEAPSIWKVCLRYFEPQWERIKTFASGPQCENIKRMMNNVMAASKDVLATTPEKDFVSHTTSINFVR